MKLHHLAATAALAVAALSAPSLVSAAQPVRYDFTALSSFEVSGEQFSGSFSVMSDGFVTSDTIFPVGDLISCNVIVTPSAEASCRDQEFMLDVSPDTVTVSFGVHTDNNPGTGIFYYFDASAFSTPGLHETVIFGENQMGTLLVTAVPEPGTYALMLCGLAGVAAWARRRQTET